MVFEINNEIILEITQISVLGEEINKRTDKRSEMRMTWEQFEQMNQYTQEYSNKVLTNIECPKCGKKLSQRTDIVLTSYPCQYQYECECGFIGYSHAQWEEGLLK